ncbi:muramoyltetrapeptide carboxypeptidase [Nonlabens dokdonensis]|uniref:Muramoyltetrapeptide carboxypeptidase n=1 Tax=Nonlabens dokdonensis TaxID=328515 RepID=A0ABX5PTX6_9FLAO|nr:muramoyltetrapeptide carboxypeptidase [Nonlabens dokdonensis]
MTKSILKSLITTKKTTLLSYLPISFLNKGKHVRIICTARSAQKSDLLPAAQLLESWGLKVSFGTTIGKMEHQFGGTKKERLADLQQAIDDKDVHAIWIARGGYGTVQLIDEVHFSAFAKAEPTTIIGYSDITLLHGKLQSEGFSSIHSFMPLELKNKPNTSIESLRKALFGEQLTVTIPNTFALKNQELKAPIVGGNLSILYSLLGSNSFPETKDQVLFIEDIDEYVYHLERIMYSLKRAGKLKSLKALLVGGMTDMNDHETPFGKNAVEIIQSLTADYDYPVIFNFPAGHIEDHRTIILGKEIHIKITDQQINLTQ